MYLQIEIIPYLCILIMNIIAIVKISKSLEFRSTFSSTRTRRHPINSAAPSEPQQQPRNENPNEVEEAEEIGENEISPARSPQQTEQDEIT